MLGKKNGNVQLVVEANCERKLEELVLEALRDGDGDGEGEVSRVLIVAATGFMKDYSIFS